MGRKDEGLIIMYSEFVGLSFQFNSAFYKRNNLEKALNRACSIAEEDLKNDFNEIKLNYQPLIVEESEYIFNVVTKKIKKCNLLIAEISDNNNNVFLEMGYALGIGINVIFCLHSRADESNFRLPSDLDGFYLLRYHTLIELRDKLAKQIKHYFQRKWSMQTSFSYKIKLYDDFWHLLNEKEVSIVSGEVILPDGPVIVHTGDRDAFSEVNFALSQIYPNLRIKRITCSKFSSTDFSGNIISIGGPNSNTVTRRLLEQAHINLKFVNKDSEILGQYPKEILYDGSPIPVQPIYGDNSIIQEVICIISGPNPFNKLKRMTILFGIHTYGVFGAAKTVIGTGIIDLDELNLQFLNKTLIKDKICMIFYPVPLVNLECVINLIENAYIIQ